MRDVLEAFRSLRGRIPLASYIRHPSLVRPTVRRRVLDAVDRETAAGVASILCPDGFTGAIFEAKLRG